MLHSRLGIVVACAGGEHQSDAWCNNLPCFRILGTSRFGIDLVRPGRVASINASRWLWLVVLLFDGGGYS